MDPPSVEEIKVSGGVHSPNTTVLNETKQFLSSRTNVDSSVYAQTKNELIVSDNHSDQSTSLKNSVLNDLADSLVQSETSVNYPQFGSSDEHNDEEVKPIKAEVEDSVTVPPPKPVPEEEEGLVSIGSSTVCQYPEDLSFEILDSVDDDDEDDDEDKGNTTVAKDVIIDEIKKNKGEKVLDPQPVHSSAPTYPQFVLAGLDDQVAPKKVEPLKPPAGQTYEDVLKLVHTVEASKKTRKNYPFDVMKVVFVNKEYASKYKEDSTGTRFLEKTVTYMKSLGIRKGLMEKNMNNDTYYLRRFGVRREIIERYIGHQRVGTVIPYLESRKSRTMSKMYVYNFSQTAPNRVSFTQGGVHVSVGLVDFSQLLNMEFREVENAPFFRFVAVESEMFYVAKNLIIFDMLLHKAPVDSIIEVWYSSTWKKRSYRAFISSIDNLLSRGAGLNDAVVYLLKTWKSTQPLSSKTAKDKWLAKQKHDGWSAMIPFNMRDKTDRVETCRYLLTGEMFPSKKKIEGLGNVMMFQSPSVITDRMIIEENFMFTIPYYSKMVTLDSNKHTFREVVVGYLRGSLKKLQRLIVGRKIKVDIIVQYIKGSLEEDMGVLTDIRKRNPSTIDWGNLGDQVSKEEFLKMAQFCSRGGGHEVNHYGHSISWKQFLFGIGIGDYPSIMRKQRFAAAEKTFRSTNKKNKITEYCLNEPVTSYQNIFMHTMGKYYRKQYLDYFFKRTNSSVLLVKSTMIPLNPYGAMAFNLYFKFMFPGKAKLAWKKEIQADGKARCDQCKKEYKSFLELKRCGKCKCVYYCDRKCQTKHWKKHKVICGDLLRTRMKRK